MSRLAILSTHPIQYNAPLFRMLHDEDGLDVQVFFSRTWNQVRYDPDFRRNITWDVPLNNGYTHSTHDASSFSGKLSLIQAIKAFEPDAILIYGWNFPGHLITMCHFKGRIPIWFRGDSHLLDDLPIFKKAIRRVVLRWVYKHVDLAFAVGEANKAYFHWCGVDSSAILLAPHAVDQAFFKRDDASRLSEATKKRNELGILPNEQVILFAGKLEPKKQPDLLLEAWSQLPLPRPHILFAGSGVLEEQLRSKWGDSPNVHFIGFQNQQAMPVIYRMADLLCLPSRGPEETWGLAVNEAMACKIPCLVSDKAGCSLDMFYHLENGRVVPWDKPHKWTQSISLLLNQRKTGTIKEPIVEEFSLDRFARAISDQINKL